MKAAVRFRLYVGLREDADLAIVEAHAASRLDYATVFAATGVYAGARERSAVVEVVEHSSPTSVDVTLRQLGAWFCRTFEQESYGLTRESVEVTFVEVPDDDA